MQAAISGLGGSSLTTAATSNAPISTAAQTNVQVSTAATTNAPKTTAGLINPTCYRGDGYCKRFDS